MESKQRKNTDKTSAFRDIEEPGLAGGGARAQTSSTIDAPSQFGHKGQEWFHAKT